MFKSKKYRIKLIINILFLITTSISITLIKQYNYTFGQMELYIFYIAKQVNFNVDNAYNLKC